MKNVDLMFDNIFNEKIGKNKFLFKQFGMLYDLPKVSSNCDISKELFEYCIKKDYFILLLLYDEKGRVFFERNMSNTLSWGLPGGSIESSESFNQAITRLSKKINENILIGNVEPITYIENEYKYKDKNKIHYGLGFIARVRNIKDLKLDKTPGGFINVNKTEAKYINRLASKKMVELFLKRFSEIVDKSHNSFQDQEITVNENMNKRYIFHRNVVKRFILTDKKKKKKEFKNIISNHIGDAKSIIDVSCGDDSFIFNLAREKEIPLVVGNDISWSQVETLNNNFQEVIFTNHNASSLPFKTQAFDISYISNTLHHMPNKETLVNTLESMFNISKKIIVVEIENPQLTGGFAKWLNKNYFIGFLKDVGGAYLSAEDFKTIINNIFCNRAEIIFTEFENIMGKYFIAVIEKKEEIYG